MAESNQIHIREARDSDQAAIREVTLTAYEQYVTALSPQGWASYRTSILEMLDTPGPAARIVAEQAGAIVGSALLFPPNPDVFPAGTHPVIGPEVRVLAVAPAARRQGVATALMQECLRRARQAGATVLQLHTTDLMPVAIQMYEHMGFVRAPELDFHPAPNFVVKAYRRILDDLA